MIQQNFWKNKRVFITGHTGFKGSWLCLWLHSMGAIVQGYALPAPTKPSLFEVIKLQGKISSEEGDIRDKDKLYDSINRFKPDIVFHMAAQSLVRLSYDEPVDTYSTNVMGTVHLLEAVRKVSGIKAVVNVTSDKCYENREWIWGYRETDAMGGFDPYSSSKGCSELVASSYRRSFFNPEQYKMHGCALACARAGNVIGGGDWALNRLVPDALKAFANQEALIIRNVGAIRPWQHVLEPLSGYLLLAEKLVTDGCEFADGWNFGPKDDDAKSVQWVVEKLVSEWGDGASWNAPIGEHPHEACFLKLDCSKARTQLGWQPHWGLEQALNRTVNWHKAWLSHTDMFEYTLTEIQDYLG